METKQGSEEYLSAEVHGRLRRPKDAAAEPALAPSRSASGFVAAAHTRRPLPAVRGSRGWSPRAGERV